MIRENDIAPPELYDTIDWGDRRNARNSGRSSGTSQDLIAWNRIGEIVLLAARCGHCNGTGDFLLGSGERVPCNQCSGRGWFGIDPKMPVNAAPGSVEKQAMLVVRYASGVPLWNREDGPEPTRTQPATPPLRRTCRPSSAAASKN